MVNQTLCLNWWLKTSPKSSVQTPGQVNSNASLLTLNIDGSLTFTFVLHHVIGLNKLASFHSTCHHRIFFIWACSLCYQLITFSCFYWKPKNKPHVNIYSQEMDCEIYATKTLDINKFAHNFSCDFSYENFSYQRQGHVMLAENLLQWY